MGASRCLVDRDKGLESSTKSGATSKSPALRRAWQLSRPVKNRNIAARLNTRTHCRKNGIESERRCYLRGQRRVACNHRGGRGSDRERIRARAGIEAVVAIVAG